MIKSSEFLEYIEKANMWDHNINYRQQPEFYVYTKDCGGMYTCEPYKTEIIKHWKFMSEDAALKASLKLFNMFREYVKNRDFVGSDMIRKYFQTGATKKVIPKECREIFKKYYQKTTLDSGYNDLKSNFLSSKKMKEA